MELFTAASGERLFFGNLIDPDGRDIVFLPTERRFEPISQDLAACKNRSIINCNWAADGDHTLCKSCLMTRTKPDLAVHTNVILWTDAELAKRWVVANVMRWGIFAPNDTNDKVEFDFLSEQTRSGEKDIVMGHDDGLITIIVQEADPAIREDRRQALNERYRTMVGHIRHELAHALFLRLSKNKVFLSAFRDLFGNEESDYSAALKRHYDQGPPADWQKSHLTEYASAHPHEDWAETCAHYLHLVDIVDSARATGLSQISFDPYNTDDCETLLQTAAKLGVKLNHINRSMGLNDLYPFVFSPKTEEKLAFVHSWVRRSGGSIVY